MTETNPEAAESRVEPEVIVTGRHFKVTDAMRAQVEKNVSHLAIGAPPTRLATTLDLDNGRPLVRMDVTLKTGETLHASSVGSDLYVAIDHAGAKIARIMRKRKTARLRPRSESKRKSQTQV